MKILISNDDGYSAPGIIALAAALKDLAQVTVIAPERDRSAASNSLTLDSPLRVKQHPNGFYSIDATPTDCVHLAITGWLDEHPDMIVSGINAGANLGDDVLYSGTVAAAMEGRFLGYPSMAVSLVGHPSHIPSYEMTHFETAAHVAKIVLETIMAKPLAKDTILNINVPDRPIAELKGLQITRLGHRHLAEKMIPGKDPRGRTIYWIGPAGTEQDAGPGTDFHAVINGYVSITPIKIDLTDYKAMDGLSDWAKHIKLS